MGFFKHAIFQYIARKHTHTHTHYRTVHYTDIRNYLHGNNGTKYCAVWAIMSILYEALCSCLKLIHIIDCSTTEKRFPTTSTSLWLILNIFLPLHPCLLYVMRKYPWHITRISDVLYGNNVCDGAQRGWTNNGIGIGDLAGNGAEVQMAGGCTWQLLCISICSSRCRGPLFFLLRAALWMGLSSIYAAPTPRIERLGIDGERARRQLALSLSKA